MTGSGTAAGLGASPGGESRAFAVRPAPLWILWLGLAVLLMQAAPYLSYRWLPDESWYAATGYSAEQGTGFKDVALAPNDIEGRIDTRPPGTALSAALIFRTLGVSAAKARLAPLLAGLGIVSLVFLFARQVFDEASTLIAVLLAACDTFVVGASRTVRPEALTTLFVMLALLALLGYSRRGRWIFALLAGMAMGVGALCHITIGGFIAACAVLVFVLDVRRGVLPVRGVACFLAGFFAALLPFVLWVWRSPLGVEGFRQEYTGRAGASSLARRLMHEGTRYRDFLGIGYLHGRLSWLPLRVAVPLLFLAASVVVWRYRRAWFGVEVLMVLLPAMWLVYTVNKTSRYFALFAPVFALTIAAAVFLTRDRARVRRWLLIGAAAVIALQFFANLALLRAARNANYTAVGRQLRAMIPRGSATYGTITFWLAMHDSPYISYERTDPWQAADDFHARYFIAGDKVMTQGLPGDEAFYDALREHMAQIAAQSDVVGTIHGGYYGDLTVLRLHDGAHAPGR